MLSDYFQLMNGICDALNTLSIKTFCTSLDDGTYVQDNSLIIFDK